MAGLLVLGTGAHALAVARRLNGSGVSGFLQVERLPAPVHLLGLPVISRWTPQTLPRDAEVVSGLLHHGSTAYWERRFLDAGVRWRRLEPPAADSLLPTPEGRFLPPDAPEVAQALQDMSHDVYHLPGYLELSARQEKAEPLVYLGLEGAARILIPLLKRDLPAELGGAGFDLTSPYGYPCPLLSLTDRPGEAEQLLRGFRERAAALGAVSVFLRLHPLYPLPLDALGAVGQVVAHGQTVTMDLQLDEEEGWKQTRQRHRTQIRALERDGFRVEIDRWEQYPEFQRIYLETMRRVGATSYYLFDEEYYRDLRQVLGDRLHLMSVIAPDGRVAAAALFMRQSGLLQYHLSGTEEAFLPQGPTKLIFHVIRSWGRVLGLRYLHLGGGLGGSNQDPLFRFKTGFSSRTSEFHSYRIVADQTRYDELTGLRRDREGPGFDEAVGSFFPAYRKRLG